MKSPSLLLRLSLLTALMTGGYYADAATLNIGDPTPKLAVGEWIQGEAVSQFDTNHVYLIEFWATWCGPCRQAIPHINNLAEKFQEKGLIVIGQDVWDADEKVKLFLTKKSNEQKYRVALDDKRDETNGLMAVNWLKAAGQTSIPATFIVDRRGCIAWIGSPFGVTTELVYDVLNRYDSPQVQAHFEKEKLEYHRWLQLHADFDKFFEQNEWDQADSALNEILQMFPEVTENSYISIVLAPPNKDGYAVYRVQILIGQKKHFEVCKLAESFNEAHSDSQIKIPRCGNQMAAIARLISTEKEVDPCEMILAEKLAQRVNAVTGGNQPGILDILARAQFQTGKTNEAILTEQKAIQKSTGKEDLRRYNETLASYKLGKLPELTLSN